MPWSSKQVRSIEWSRTYTWDFMFQGAPSPFNRLMPTTTVSYLEWDVGIESMNVASFPSIAETAPTLSITFYDNVDMVLYNWFKAWAKDITKAGMVLPVASAVKPCRLIKYKWNITNSRSVSSGVSFRKNSNFFDHTIDDYFGKNTSNRIDNVLNQGLSGMILRNTKLPDAYEAVRSEVNEFYNKINQAVSPAKEMIEAFKGFGNGNFSKLTNSEFVTNFKQSPNVGGMQIIDDHTFLVFPTGQMTWEGENESGTHQFSVELAIAGSG